MVSIVSSGGPAERGFSESTLSNHSLCYPPGMTTEPTLEVVEETPYQMTTCSNCDGPVARRRPSLTGKHFCQKLECQRARDRFYNRRRRTGAKTEAALAERRQEEVRKVELTAFVRTALEEPRVDCADCGRGAVVPGYAHPAPDWQSACEALMTRNLPAGLGTALMRAVYPT